MLRHVLYLLLAAAAAVHAEKPLFTFGVISDVQYADHDTAGARAYRDSLSKLGQCSAALKRERPQFVVHLGDLVDRDAVSLDRILPVWAKVSRPRYLVLGNHDFVVPRDVLVKRFGMPGSWYDFTARSWRFLVIDGMNLSVSGGWPPSDPHFERGAALLEKLKQEQAPNAQTWNGAAGPEQREWLQRTLADAARKHQRAIVFCHFPALAESCRPEHLLWDHAQVSALLEASPATAAYINGHDHKGGSAQRGGVHYITMPGMVEHDAATACQVVDVYRDRLVVRRAGETEGRRFELRTAP
jgi:3',5'-cyclic AMP phosphodiesterase CpdA